MIRLLPAVVLLFAASAALVPAAQAAQRPYEQTHPRRSWFQFFIRPARETPAEQLAYADHLRETGRIKAAIGEYRALVLTWASAPEAAAAQFQYARLLEQRGKMESAIEEYENGLKKYSGRISHEEALAGLFRIGVRLLEEKKWKVFFGGFAAPERAIPAFEAVVRHGPHWEKAPEAQYLVGKAHERLQQYEEAIGAYEIVRVRYPRSTWAEKASFGEASCRYALSRESPNSESLTLEAWTAAGMFVSAYPDSEYRDIVQEYLKTLNRRRAAQAYEKARFYETVARRPEAALRSYKAFRKLYPDSEWTGLADSRIEALAQQAGQVEQAPPKAPPKDQVDQREQPEDEKME